MLTFSIFECMSKRIKPTSKGHVILSGNIINLNEYKEILLNPLGRYEDPDKEIAYSIGFVPKTPSSKDLESGVDGRWFVTYTQEEKKDFEEDYSILINAQREEDSILTPRNMIGLGALIVGIITLLIQIFKK